MLTDMESVMRSVERRNKTTKTVVGEREEHSSRPYYYCLVGACIGKTGEMSRREAHGWRPGQPLRRNAADVIFTA